MKKSKYTVSQIVNILKEAEAGVSLEDLIHQYGFSKVSFVDNGSDILCDFWRTFYSDDLSSFTTDADT